MRIPAIQGVIDRRILANYRIDPTCMTAVLPPPFRPKLVNGYAIGGICLIRLKQIRPKLLPIPWGICSENAAHRIAVEWDANGETVEGVYIPRRDSNSMLNSLAGGRLFPGIHHYAKFDVNEGGGHYCITMTSGNGDAEVHVSGSVDDKIASSSVFSTLDAASDFFRRGSLGYSDTGMKGRYDGLELRCQNWHVESLQVESIRSSYFEDKSKFPMSTVEFDCALLMRNIAHECHGQPELCCST